MKYHTSRLRSRQQGVALIIAMLIFALATTLVVAMSSEFTLFLKRGSNSFIASQSQAYLRGGEDLAGLALLQDAEEDLQENSPRDDLTEFWAQQVPPYALDEGGWLTGTLVDLESRININSLTGAPAKAEDRFTAAQEQFIRLLQVFEEPRVSEEDATLITEALLDWLDSDSEPRDFGAEDSFYIDAEPPYLAANMPMQSVSELRMVANMTPEIFLAVAPFLTVWGPGDSINIHTAPLEVLRTINAKGDRKPLSQAEGESLVDLRGEEGFENVNALTESQVLNGREFDPQLLARLTESSTWFLYSGEVEVADRTTRLYSVLKREEGAVKALQRSSGSL
ncbi:MAG: type II secretion system minor pseudopilin GspK [Halieaceae bacterium]